MTNFHVRQKVVCVDAGVRLLRESPRLSVGNIYTVTAVNEGFPSVWLAETTSHTVHGFWADRFRPVSEIDQFRRLAADVKAGKTLETV